MWQEYGGHSPPCKNDMWMPRSLRMSSDLHLDCIAIPWAEFLRDGSIQTSQSPDSALKSQAHGTYFQLDNHVAYQASLPVAVAFFLKKKQIPWFFRIHFQLSTQVATLAFGACLGYMAARVITKGCVVGGDSSSFRMVRGRYLQIFAWRMVMEDVFICFYCHLLRARCKEQEASSDGRLLLFYFRVACESRCTKLPGFFWRHTHSSVSGISEKEFYPESHPGSLATAMHRTRSMDSAQSQRCYWTAGVVWLQIPSRSDPILFEMDWLTLIEIDWKLIQCMGFYIFLPGAPPHSIYDPHGAFCRMHCWESKLACLRCEKVWAFKRKVQCCLFSGPWVCSDKWGAGKDSSFTWLHSNGIAGAGWAWDSNLGVSRNQFTFLHVSPHSHYFKMGQQNQMLASHRWQYENLARRALLKADRGRRPVMTYFLWVVKGAPLL